MVCKPGNPETPVVLGLLGPNVIFQESGAAFKNICEVCIR
jgi:hypothetical protein